MCDYRYIIYVMYTHTNAQIQFSPQREPWQGGLVVRYLGSELDLLFSIPCSTFPGCVILVKLPLASVYFLSVMNHNTYFTALLCVLS